MTENTETQNWDYIQKFKELRIENNTLYPRNDIGIARLFFNLHSDKIRFVREAKTWYVFDDRRWLKEDGGFSVMEMCKSFAQNYAKYAELFNDGSSVGEAFVKYASGLTGRKRREGILTDARSIEPKYLADFDKDKTLFNCLNGTYNLTNMTMYPHNPNDFITKMADVKYVPTATSERWEQFIQEIMCGDTDTEGFLQKALGYGLSGETFLECFFILHGSKTRNGKTTLIETISNVMGDYAKTIQPQTLSRRPSDGSSASPDIARLKGARLVSMPEPERGLELNIALIKQLTGGDTYTGRFLHENPFEFRPECKIYINTNHLPRTADDTVFSSGRIKLIPFDRHFLPREQDTGLKKLFQKNDSKSAVLNWLIEGYRLLQEEGLEPSEKIKIAISEYRFEADVFGSFLMKHTIFQEGCRLPTKELYSRYTHWTKDNGYSLMNNKDFIEELRKRYDVRRSGKVGKVIIGLTLLQENSSQHKAI